MSTLKVGAIKGVSASSDAITVANDGTCTANITNNLSNRNKVINGAMTISQRGTSFTASGTGSGYGIDRFQENFSMDGGYTLTQSTTSPDGFANSMKVDVTSADTSLAAGQFVEIKHKIEAQDLQDLAFGTSAAKTVVLSFYVRSNKTGNYAFAIQQSDNSFKQASFQYTISSADTWERKTIVIAGDTSGVINDDNGDGLILMWALAAGSNLTGGSLRSTFTTRVAADQYAGQGVNLLDSTSNEWYITGIQLEVGEHATDFEHRSFAQEIVLCKRYYRILQDASGGAIYMGAVAYNYDVNSVVVQVNFETEMRATPTLNNTSGTNYYRFYRNSGYVDINAMNAINGMNKYGGGFNNSDSGNGTAGQAGAIVLNNTAAKIAFDAEI